MLPLLDVAEDAPVLDEGLHLCEVRRTDRHLCDTYKSKDWVQEDCSWVKYAKGTLLVWESLIYSIVPFGPSA